MYILGVASSLQRRSLIAAACIGSFGLFVMYSAHLRSAQPVCEIAYVVAQDGGKLVSAMGATLRRLFSWRPHGLQAK